MALLLVVEGLPRGYFEIHRQRSSERSGSVGSAKGCLLETHLLIHHCETYSKLNLPGENQDIADTLSAAKYWFNKRRQKISLTWLKIVDWDVKHQSKQTNWSSNIDTIAPDKFIVSLISLGDHLKLEWETHNVAVRLRENSDQPGLLLTRHSRQLSPACLSIHRITLSYINIHDKLHPLWIIEPRHEISNNVVCATSKASDQPVHMRSLIRALASRLNILWVLSYWLNKIWSF